MKKIIIFFSVFVIGSAIFAADFSAFKLHNGQSVIIQEVHTNPIVTIDTWVKTGSINETDQNNGVSHFLEHLFFKGTLNHQTGEFDRILEAKGAVNNAATSKDFTHYYITIPSKDFDLAMEMHADMLQNIAIPEKEFEQERKVVLEEISKDINLPSSKVYDNLVEMMYINHPYKRKVIGTSDIIQNITREEIFDYFDKYYAPSNMTTIIVGDVDTKTALKKVEESFSKRYKKTPKHSYYKEKPIPSILRKIEYMDTQSGYILIGFRGVPIIHKDAYALDVLATILGDGRSSVLYKTIKNKKQLAFSISAQNSTFKDDGIFYISANFVPKNYQELEDNVFDEIEKIKQDGVCDEQVELAKNIIEKDTYYSRESVSDIAQEIGYTVTTTNGTSFYDNYLCNIKKVTAEDVKSVAQKYLGIDKSAISVVLPNNMKEVKVSSFTPLSTQCQQTGQTELTQTKPTAVLESRTGNTEKYILTNGATLLLTPNSVNDIVAISIFVKGGEFLEKIAGVGKLTASTMLRGTKNYTMDELAIAMENNGIKIAPISKADTFRIEVITTKQQYDKTFELLNEIVNNATFEDEQISKAKMEALNSIKRERDIPVKKAAEEFSALIYQNSVYSNSLKILEKNYPKITRANIVEYYGKIFEPKNIVISVNGNVDTDKTIDELTKIFKPKNQLLFDFSKYSIPIISTRRISEQVDKTTQTDWIFLGWQTDGITNLKDYATLSVMDSLLGSGMSSRLFRDLREKNGLAYQLGSAFNPNMRRGNFVLYIGTNHKTLQVAKNKLFEEIKRLKTEPVDTQELQEAKEKLLGQFILSQETNSDKASTIGWFEASGRGYDFKDDYINLITEVTSSDIMKVANKYFRDNYVLSVVKQK